MVEHAERILDSFVVRAADRDALFAHAVAVAIFAKKHTVAEAFRHARDFRRQVKNAGREQDSCRAVRLYASAENENRSFDLDLLDLIFREIDLVPLRLTSALPEQLFARDAIGKAR